MQIKLIIVRCGFLPILARSTLDTKYELEGSNLEMKENLLQVNPSYV